MAIGGLALLIQWQCLSLPTRAAASQIPTTSVLAGKSAASDGKAFLKSVIAKVKSLDEYSFESVLTSYTKRKPIVEKGKLYFKSPNLVRFEVIEAGSKSGSIVVREVDGRIRGKAGGFLSGIVVNLSPQSKILKAANGYNILKSDLLTLLEDTLNKLGNQHKCLAASAPIPYPGRDNSYIIEILADNGLVEQRIILDKAEKLPVEWCLFEDDKLFSITRIQKLDHSKDIEDSLFSLGTKQIASASKAFGDSTPDLVERLNKSLQGPSARLTVETMRDVRAQVNELKVSAQALAVDNQSSIESTDDSTAHTWSSTGRQSLLVRTSAIELIKDNLTRVGELLESQVAADRNSSSADRLAASWQKSLSAIDQSIGQLYTLMEADKPDSTAIMAQSGALKNESGKLEALCQDALFLVD